MQYLKQDGESPLLPPFYLKPTGGQLSLEWYCPVGGLDPLPLLCCFGMVPEVVSRLLLELQPFYLGRGEVGEE